MDDTLITLGILALKALVILGVGVAAMLALRRSSAALRHTIGTLVLVSVVVLPLLSTTLPSWRVEVPAETLASVSGSADNTDMEPVSVDTEATTTTNTGDEAVTPPTKKKTHAESAKAESRTVAKPKAPPEKTETAAPVMTDGPRETSDSGAFAAFFSSWSLSEILVLIWLLGAAAVIAPLVAAAVTVRRILHNAEPVTDAAWLELVGRIRRRLGVRRPVILMRSRENVIPMTWGFLRPRVVLPHHSDDWEREQREMVLLHELAHVSRWDWVALVVAQVATALHWFNPLVWLARRRHRLDGERACDDIVIAQGYDPTRYADSLLRMARALRPPRLAAALTVPIAHPSLLERRLLMILDSSSNRRAPGVAIMIGVVLTAVAVVLPLSSLSVQAINDATVNVDPDLFITNVAIDPDREREAFVYRVWGGWTGDLGDVVIEAKAKQSSTWIQVGEARPMDLKNGRLVHDPAKLRAGERYSFRLRGALRTNGGNVRTNYSEATAPMLLPMTEDWFCRSCTPFDPVNGTPGNAVIVRAKYNFATGKVEEQKERFSEPANIARPTQLFDSDWGLQMIKRDENQRRMAPQVVNKNLPRADRRRFLDVRVRNTFAFGNPVRTPRRADENAKPGNVQPKRDGGSSSSRKKSDKKKAQVPKAFQQKITVSFEDTPFREVIDFLRSVTGYNIHVHWRKLEEWEIDRDTEVNLRLNDIRADAVLRFILSSISDGLRYRFENGIAIIGTEELDDREPDNGWKPHTDGSEESAKTLERLETPLTVQLDEQSFAETIDFLRAISGLNFVVHWRTLEEYELDRDTEVNVKLSNVPLRLSLKLLLESLNDDLEYSIDTGVIVVRERQDR